MDYAIALIIYVCSILGVFTSMYCMVLHKDEKPMLNLMAFTCFVFCGTTFMGGAMLNAIGA